MTQALTGFLTGIVLVLAGALATGLVQAPPGICSADPTSLCERARQGLAVAAPAIRKIVDAAPAAPAAVGAEFGAAAVPVDPARADDRGALVAEAGAPSALAAAPAQEPARPPLPGREPLPVPAEEAPAVVERAPATAAEAASAAFAPPGRRSGSVQPVTDAELDVPGPGRTPLPVRFHSERSAEGFRQHLQAAFGVRSAVSVAVPGHGYGVEVLWADGAERDRAAEVLTPLLGRFNAAP